MGEYRVRTTISYIHWTEDEYRTIRELPKKHNVAVHEFYKEIILAIYQEPRLNEIVREVADSLFPHQEIEENEYGETIECPYCKKRYLLSAVHKHIKDKHPEKIRIRSKA